MQREEKTKEKMEMKEDFDVFKTENTIRLNEDGGVEGDIEERKRKLTARGMRLRRALRRKIERRDRVRFVRRERNRFVLF